VDPADQGFAVWITGLPASGKSTVRAHLVERLRASGIDVAVLESDVLRKELGADQAPDAYHPAGRERFYRSVVWIGHLLTRHGVPVIFDATANRRAYRDHARGEIRKFLEVWVDTPLEVCMERDPKGIYRRGVKDAAGAVPGLQDAYEPPEAPEVRIDGLTTSPEAAAGEIFRTLFEAGFVGSGPPAA
jgi:adenylylsulfate kinase